MTDLQTELVIGELAKRTLDELKARFDLIRANIHAKWEQTSSVQQAEREMLYNKLHALNELERSFTNDIQTAKFAEKQLETENVSTKHPG